MRKRAKSIKARFGILILVCILASSAVLGGLSILYAQRVIDNVSAQNMLLLCQNRAQYTNALLSRIELSVQTVSVYIQSQMDDFGRFKTEEEYVEAFAQSLLDVSLNAAENTDGAIAVYLRFNPGFTSPTSGFFYSKSTLAAPFEKQTPTNLTAYAPTDIGRVGWYYVPVENRSATWMSPYYNENLGVKMISYVIPLYVGNTVFGVVGMDIDFSVLQQIVDETRLYETGYAFLFDEEANIVSHKELKEGTSLAEVNGGELANLLPKILENEESKAPIPYRYGGQDKMLVFSTLLNGCKLVLSAPVREIDAERNTLFWQIVLAAGVVALLSILFTLLFTRRLIRPLSELNAAAKKIAGGDLDVTICYQGEDEVGTLAESFRQTAQHLKKYIGYISEQAYHDSLTGVKNKTAYMEAAAQIEQRMREAQPNFGLLLFDMNNLKQINDQYGHDMGDLAIMGAVRLICQVFKRSPVYRVGGDEFVVLLEGDDLGQHPALLAEYTALASEEAQPGMPKAEMAYGLALYNPAVDTSFQQVFKRADEAMYEKKLEMKGKA